MPPLPPLRFQPLFKRYLWGGRRLASVLNKPLGEGEDYAESWEIVDHGRDQSLVLAGPCAGLTLHDVSEQYGPELYGRHHPQPKFPLLLKFLDCHLVLSVQAHPNDRQAQALTPPDLGKTEAWYVLEAEPGSRIYAGLKDGVDRPALAAALEDGSVADCLHAFSPRVGDCVFIPAGTVHALGAGLMVVEIQQSSNTTFRLFDWNRVGPDGQPRPLHVSDALNVIDYSRGPMMPVSANVDDAGVRRLVTCDKFQLEEWRISQSRAVGGDGRFHLIAVVSGELMIDGDPVGTPLTRGDTSLIPAAVATSLIPAGSATVLVGSLP